MTNVTAQPDPRLLKLSSALLLEQALRSKTRAGELCHALVNDTAQIHGHELAFLLVARGGSYRLTAATAVADPDRSGPLGQWLEKRGAALQPVARAAVPFVAELESPAEDWASGLPRHCLVLPLPKPGGHGNAGVLLLLRAQPWQDAERLLAEPLADCYGHALWTLRHRLPDLSTLNRRRTIAIATALILAGLIPVRLDTLAPAEVAAIDAIPVTAPFDGIVADIPVRPYQLVHQGDALVVFDTHELAMKRDVALRSLDVSEAELSSLRNQAFLDPDSKAKLAVAEQKVALEKENASYAQERFERHRLIAEADGLVVYDDRFNWKGKPVQTGQAIMTLAKPERKELHIDLPVAGLIPTREGAEVKLFLDMDPTTAIPATLHRLGVEARPSPAGALAYRYVAVLEVGTGDGLQLGARGTAKVYGERVSLAYYLFRRPLAALRQFFGL
jgi:hypothetical protein